jgi:hypothetical protein
MSKVEIRGTSRERHGASISLVTEDGGGFHDEGLDDVKRKTELRCWPPPSCLETKRVRCAFELAPKLEGHSLSRVFARNTRKYNCLRGACFPAASNAGGGVRPEKRKPKSPV